VGYKRIKTEHAGPKNGGEAWMTRKEAKGSARRKRRQIDKRDATDALLDEQPRAEPQESPPARSTVPKKPWADSDPQPGDFDAELDRARSDQIEIYEGNPDVKLSILVSVEGDDAKRLERIATERGQQPGEVVSELLRSCLVRQSRRSRSAKTIPEQAELS
jgi:hypothetical protein